jgi:hypothetical protein
VFQAPPQTALSFFLTSFLFALSELRSLTAAYSVRETGLRNVGVKEERILMRSVLDAAPNVTMRRAVSEQQYDSGQLSSWQDDVEE